MRGGIAALLWALTCCASACAAAATQPEGATGSRLAIRVEGADWGEVENRRIETVLHGVADVLFPRLRHTSGVAIVVRHTSSNPAALYERGSAGEYLVELHASDTRWHLYAYEFAHELCHIVSNFERNAGPGIPRHNQWFEETLCEAASLFALTRLALAWEREPPAAEWLAQVPGLRRFADRLLDEAHRKLPARTTLAAWVQDNQPSLRTDPYQRQKNELVANQMLPLFERDPLQWDALRYLNLGPDDTHNDLQRYLGNWYRNAPAQHRAFVAGLGALCGIASPAPDAMLAQNFEARPDAAGAAPGE